MMCALRTGSCPRRTLQAALDLCGAPPATLTVMGGASSLISPHEADGVRKHPLAPVSAIAVQGAIVPAFAKRAW